MNRSVLAISAITLAVLVELVAPRLSAQSAASRTPIPQWQIDAGGSAKFDVASVKQNKSGPPPYGDKPYSEVMGIPIDRQVMVYRPNGGLFTATNIPLIQYIVFAYEITGSQLQDVLPQLPKWVTTDRFDMQARAKGNPTSDQMRLMLQSFLAEHFKLTVHNEVRQIPVFALVSVKPGRLGPQLQPYTANELPCSPVPSPPRTTADGFPTYCGEIIGMEASGPEPCRRRAGARNVTMSYVAGVLAAVNGGLDRHVFDKTGLSGTFDLAFEWAPQRDGLSTSCGNSDATGPTFMEALQEQLGLKLELQTGPVDVLVIDHVEEPSPN